MPHLPAGSGISARLAPPKTAATSAIDGGRSRRGSVPSGSLRSAILAAASVAGVVAALRLAGIVHGITAVLLLLVLIVALPHPARFGERILVVLVVILGWVPLAGWFPGALTRIDVPGMSLALFLGSATYWRVRQGWSRPRFGWADGLAIFAGVATALWWAVPFARGGSGRRLALLMRGWDHVAHLAFFARIVELGGFGPLERNAPADGVWKGWDYPQGMHQAWATIYRLLSPRGVPDPGDIVNAYSAAVVVTAGVTVMLSALAISRLVAGGIQSAVVALPALVASAILLSAGLGSMGVSFGFANFILAVVALATAASFAIRPSPSHWLDSVVIGGCLLIGAYNWYPLVLVAWPLAIPLGLRLAARSAKAMAAPVAVYVVALALPAVFTLHFGVEILNRPGGIPHLSRTWTAASLLALIAVALWAQGWIVRPASWSLLGVAAGGALSMAALAAQQIRSIGELTYYFEKLSFGIAILSLLIVALVITHRLEQAAPGTIVLAELGAIVVVASSISVLRMPAWSDALGSYSGGAAVHRAYREEPQPIVRAADDLLVAATRVAARGSQSRFRTLLIDTDDALPPPLLSDFWLAALTGAWTEDRAARSDSLVLLARPTRNVRLEADLVLSLLGNPNSHDLIVRQDLLSELAGRDPAWTAGSIVLAGES